MCRRLDDLRQSIAELAGGFDARTLSAAQAGEVVGLCARIEASAASIEALAAARCAEAKTWERDGYRCAADQLADQAGMSPSNAKRLLETGQRMAEQPEVAAAALSGDLSMEKTAAVADGASADPSKAGMLIESAKQRSMPELNEEVAKVKAAAVDQERRRRERHKRRSLRRWTDRDGALQAHMYGQPEDGARLWQMLDPVRRRLNMLRREAGRERDSFDALDYDAMMTVASVAAGRDGELGLSDLLDLGLFPQLDADLLAHRSTDSFGAARADCVAGAPGAAGAEPAAGAPGGEPAAGADCAEPAAGAPGAEPAAGAAGAEPAAGAPGADCTTFGSGRPTRKKKLAGRPVKINIRVDFTALLRGVAIEGELCEIAGYGPVPVSVVERLLETEDPFITGIITKGQAVVGVYHHRRRPNAHQKSALEFLYPVCAALGCNSSTCDDEHREDYAKTHITMFDFMDRLCLHHHRLKTRKNWALVEGTGKRAFVSPDDPRHPRFARGRDPTDHPAAG